MRTFILTLMCLFGVFLSQAQIKYEVTADPYLNIRSSANADSTIIGKVAKNEVLEVYEISNGWGKISYNGEYGYVNSEYLSEVTTTSSKSIVDTVVFDYLPTLNVSWNMEWMVYVIGILSLLLLCIRKKRWKIPLNVQGKVFTINWVLFLVMCTFELVYVFIERKNAIWFLDPDQVGIVTIINFILFIYFAVNQIFCFLDTLRDIADTRGDESLDFRLGIYSWPIAIIAIIVSAIIFQEIIYILVIGGAFIICQLIQIGLIIWKMKPNGGLKYTFICIIVYLLGSLSTLLVLILSLIVLCIILIFLFTLKAVLESRRYYYYYE